MLVTEAAERLGIPYVLFNQREAGYADIHLEVKNGRVDGAFRIRDADLPLHGFSGVYVRLMDHKDLPENKPRGRTPADVNDVF